MGNRASGAVLVPKSLLLLLLILRTPPTPAGTRFYLHKEFEISKSAWYGFAWSKCDFLILLWTTCRIFFPNDLRCGFRKLKERGVGNRTSGAVLVPKSLLLLLLLLMLCPRSRPRPHFTYTKNSRYQNQHGMDLHGQSDLSPSCLGPRVAFFCRTGAVGLQAIDAFFTF